MCIGVNAARCGTLSSQSAPEADLTGLKQCYTHAEVRQVLRIGRDALNTLIANDRLPGAKKLGHAKKAQWLIPRKSLESFIAQYRFPGRVVSMNPSIHRTP